MKRNFISTITLSLALGAASSSFAAANPFADVPRDHWSFDAVQTLAQAGVIEGYGDGTLCGDRHITRYEMATMVARAMAKEKVSVSEKETIDKLAAEYADELQNLGVRVTELEKKSDAVTFAGSAKIESSRTEHDGVKDATESIAHLELDITAKVNEDWVVQGALEAENDLKENTSSDVELTQVYAKGPLFGATAKLGKFTAFDGESLSTGGMILDTEISGAMFSFGGKLLTELAAGRLDADGYALTEGLDASDYQSVQFTYQPSDKWAAHMGYYHLKNNNAFADGNSFRNDNHIFHIALDYEIAPALVLGGNYAMSSLDAAPGADKKSEKAYGIQLTYRGAEADVPHSYGVWAAYRQLGELSVIAPTYDGADVDQRGVEVGVDYMLAKNILGKVIYFDGEEINSGDTVKKLFGQLEFSF